MRIIITKNKKLKYFGWKFVENQETKKRLNTCGDVENKMRIEYLRCAMKNEKGMRMKEDIISELRCVVSWVEWYKRTNERTMMMMMMIIITTKLKFITNERRESERKWGTHRGLNEIQKGRNTRNTKNDEIKWKY